ncbi:mechanosensitive ion channel family protein [Halobacteriaceae archaeon GCM10025711]
MPTDGLAGLLPEWVDPQWVAWLAAVLVLAAGVYLSRLSGRLLGRRVARRFQRPSMTRTVLRGIRTGVLIVAVMFAVVVAGYPIPDIVLSVTVFSAVLGIILAPIVGSVINGLFVLADQPYEIGDMIELVDTGERGYVEDITIRYTKIFTMANAFLVIPNANMRERDVINYSAEDERTRLSLELLVTYEGDLEEARELMEAAAVEAEGVIAGGPDIRIGSARYPAAPTAYIKDYADHGVLLDLRYWLKEPYYMGRVRSAVEELVWERLDDADVTIAYPHSHLVFDETSGEARVSVSHRDDRRTPPEPPGPPDGPRRE